MKPRFNGTRWLWLVLILLFLVFCLVFTCLCGLLAFSASTNTASPFQPVLTPTGFETPFTFVPSVVSETSPQPGPALEPIQIEGANMIYYDIRGQNANELSRQMDLYGPVDDDGIKRIGLTKWTIHWKWKEKACKITYTETSYTLDVVFPRWVDSGNASEPLKQKWQKYAQALADHEKRHVDIFLENYPDVQKEMKNADCNSVNGAAQSVLDRINNLNMAFDDETNHGINDGLVFP